MQEIDEGASDVARMQAPGSILVAEDEDDIRCLITNFLEEEGYATQVAANGAEALERIKQRRPDLILLDMKMPVMNGWDFVAAYRRLYDHDTPILVMTAAEHPAKRAIEVGADGWLSKPFSTVDLLAYVRKLIRAPTA